MCIRDSGDNLLITWIIRIQKHFSVIEKFLAWRAFQFWSKKVPIHGISLPISPIIRIKNKFCLWRRKWGNILCNLKKWHECLPKPAIRKIKFSTVRVFKSSLFLSAILAGFQSINERFPLQPYKFPLKMIKRCFSTVMLVIDSVRPSCSLHSK